MSLSLPPISPKFINQQPELMMVIYHRREPNNGCSIQFNQTWYKTSPPIRKYNYSIHEQFLTCLEEKYQNQKIHYTLHWKKNHQAFFRITNIKFTASEFILLILFCNTAKSGLNYNTIFTRTFKAAVPRPIAAQAATWPPSCQQRPVLHWVLSSYVDRTGNKHSVVIQTDNSTR